MDNVIDDNVIDNVADVATSDAADVAVVPATPARTRRTNTARPTVRRIRTMADAVAVARTVTVANVATLTARHNANHGIAHVARNVGRFSGMRVMDAQNVFMADNHGLNDLQIAFVFRVDFPAASGKIVTADYATAVSIVRGIRADYNRTGHGAKSDSWRTNPAVAHGETRFTFPMSGVKSA